MERVSVKLPCVFAFDKGDVELRRPNVRGIMMAKKKPIERITLADLGVDNTGEGVSTTSVDYPPEKPEGQRFEGPIPLPRSPPAQGRGQRHLRRNLHEYYHNRRTARRRIHPTLPQLVHAASVIGGECTIIIPRYGGESRSL